jgi:hypothetical protein
MKKAMKKVMPGIVALVVIAFFVLPGLAFAHGGGSGHGGGTPSPPPSNPPCDADGHNGQPPPYGGPHLHSLMCKLQRTTGHGTGNSTGNGTGNTGGDTGNACPPNSHNPGATPPPGCGHPGPSPSPSPTSSGTTGTTTGGAVCGTQLDGLPIFLHVGGAPDADTGQLIHVCVQLGGTTAPTEPCPNPPPLEIRPDSNAPSLAVCVLL